MGDAGAAGRVGSRILGSDPAGRGAHGGVVSERSLAATVGGRGGVRGDVADCRSDVSEVWAWRARVGFWEGVVGVVGAVGGARSGRRG